KRQPFKSLEMRAKFGIVSYLGTSWRRKTGDLAGTIAVLGKGTRVFSPEHQDVLLVVAGLLAPRLREDSTPANRQSQTPVSACRASWLSPPASPAMASPRKRHDVSASGWPGSAWSCGSSSTPRRTCGATPPYSRPHWTRCSTTCSSTL